jgi:hypothetical protein
LFLRRVAPAGAFSARRGAISAPTTTFIQQMYRNVPGKRRRAAVLDKHRIQKKIDRGPIAA